MFSLKKWQSKALDGAPVEPGLDPEDLEAYQESSEDRLADEVDADFEGDAPILVLVGSLMDCSKKDAIAYCKGLVEQHAVAHEASGYRLVKERFGGSVRFLYEVHEGGPGKSLLPRVLDIAKQTGSVKLRLAQGRVAEVMEVNGEVLTLIHTSDSDAKPGQVEDVAHLCSRIRLNPALGNGEGLTRLGAMMAGLSLLYLGGAAVAYYVMNQDATLQSALQRHFQVPAPTKYDGLAAQLGKARMEADRKHEALSYLQFKDGKWSWGLGAQKANEPPAAPAVAKNPTIPAAPEMPAATTGVHQ